MSWPRERRSRLLCDEMLARLGRWLRAAGYDTGAAAPGEADRHLLDRTLAEQRLLVTRDRKLVEPRRARGWVVLLHADRLAGQAEELTSLLAIDWLHAPFSRCMRCNAPLQPAPNGLSLALPHPPERRPEPLLYCPACRRPYWEGAHVRRMRAQLERWRAGCFEAPDACE